MLCVGDGGWRTSGGRGEGQRVGPAAGGVEVSVERKEKIAWKNKEKQVGKRRDGGTQIKKRKITKGRRIIRRGKKLLGTMYLLLLPTVAVMLLWFFWNIFCRSGSSEATVHNCYFRCLLS